MGELDDLGPLIHALGSGLAGPLPERVQQATVRFCADATQRWVSERGRVPIWCSDLSPIATLREQKVLDISGCQRIVSLEPLKEMRALQRLDLHDCTGIRDLSGLQRLGELQWLDLRGCTGVISLGPLAGLPSLQWLDLGGCSGVTSLAPLMEWTSCRPWRCMAALKLMIWDHSAVCDDSQGLGDFGLLWNH